MLGLRSLHWEVPTVPNWGSSAQPHSSGLFSLSWLQIYSQSQRQFCLALVRKQKYFERIYLKTNRSMQSRGQRTFGARQSSGPSERPPSFFNTPRTAPGSHLQPPSPTPAGLSHGLWALGSSPEDRGDSIKLDMSSSSKRLLHAAALSELNSAMALWFVYISHLKLTPMSQLKSLPSAQPPQCLTFQLSICVFIKVSNLQNLNNKQTKRKGWFKKDCRYIAETPEQNTWKKRSSKESGSSCVCLVWKGNATISKWVSSFYRGQ